MPTRVIFRRYTDGEIIALLPDLPGTNDPTTCSSYMHTGQHGAADPRGVVATTKPASWPEVSPLRRELRGIGYDLQLITRMPVNAYQHRKEATR